jgi:hypothetical protein
VITMRIIKETLIIALIDIVFLSIYGFSPFRYVLFSVLIQQIPVCQLSNHDLY